MCPRAKRTLHYSPPPRPRALSHTGSLQKRIHTHTHTHTHTETHRRRVFENGSSTINGCFIIILRFFERRKSGASDEFDRGVAGNRDRRRRGEEIHARLCELVLPPRPHRHRWIRHVCHLVFSDSREFHARVQLRRRRG